MEYQETDQSKELSMLEETRQGYQKFDLEERLIEFAVSILALAEKLPKNYSGKHFKQQIIRSGTSPALNYGEATAAVSLPDFLHRMRICLKELRETQINLRIISRSGMLLETQIEKELKECGELVAIFTSSVNTAKANLEKQRIKK